MSLRSLLALVGAFGLALFAAAGAQANIVSGTIGTADYEVTCGDPNVAGLCTLLDEATAGSGGDLPNASDEDVVAHLNDLVNGSFTTDDYQKTELAGGPESAQFTVTGPYFILKIDGQNAGYLFFSSAAPQTITYSATGQATGLSFYAQVPIPAALLLFLTALGGLLGWRRWGSEGGGLAPQPA